MTLVARARSSPKAVLALVAGAAFVASAGAARADDAPAPAPAQAAPAQAAAADPPAPSAPSAAAYEARLAAPAGPARDRSEADDDEAPPPPPYRPGVVIEGGLGVAAYFGSFGKVAPPGPWLQALFGYEPFPWLLVLAQGELGFTDTSNAQAQPRTRAFPLYGGSAGARFQARFGERFAAWIQGEAGVLDADVATNALRLVGHTGAESLGLTVGARTGVELRQIDRHLALGLSVGARHATSLVADREGGLALMGDLALRLRHVF